MAFADWTCEITNVAKTSAGELVIDLHFRNGVTGREVQETVRTRSAVANAAWIEDIARDRILDFDGQNINVAVGPITPSPLRQVSAQRRAWETAKRRLEARLRYRDMGVIPDTDATLVSLRADVAAGLAAFWEV